MTYRYIGGRKAVTIRLPSGRSVSVARGETTDDVLPGDAAALDRHPEWERDEPPTDPPVYGPPAPDTEEPTE